MVVTAAVIVDASGGQMGGAARYRHELLGYLTRTGRPDVQVIGSQRQISPAWLVHREIVGGRNDRRVALNNVGFFARSGERWTLLRNALHFLSEAEDAALRPASLRAMVRCQAVAVRLAAHRSDVLVVPSAAMAKRVSAIAPGLRGRIVVRAHPVSVEPAPRFTREQVIICPVVFEPYKPMAERLGALLQVVSELGDDVRVLVTAERSELPAHLAAHPRIELIGRLSHASLREWRARSRAVYFPTGLESFGYPLAEARVSGQPVIACDTEQNREIAGPALCGYTPGDSGSLRRAAELALTVRIAPDPAPFDPDRYFNWLLGAPR
jgi:glycosyltransferase involved in cell wall biosynthesis